MQEAGSISMHVYAYADVTLASLVPLPELEELHGISEPRIHCRLALASTWSDRSWEFVHDWIDVQGVASLSLFRDRDHFLLRFTDLADFYLDRTASHIEILPHANTSEETLRHLLLDQVLPRCLAHQGRLAIHGSSVELADGRVVVFLAESGSGKSTLGASFHDAGYRLLSDDGMIITPSEQSVQIVPTYTSLRLWPESVEYLYNKPAESPQLAPMAHYSRKHRVMLRSNGPINDRAGTLAGIYLLQPTDPQATATAERLSPRDAVVELIRNSFQLDVSDRRQAAERTALACDVCAQVPAYRLIVPRDFARLPEVRDIILQQQA